MLYKCSQSLHLGDLLSSVLISVREQSPELKVHTSAKLRGRRDDLQRDQTHGPFLEHAMPAYFQRRGGSAVPRVARNLYASRFIYLFINGRNGHEGQ